MKKVLAFLVSRGFIIAFSIAIQVAIWLLIVFVLHDFSSILFGLMGLLSFFCVIHIIIKDTYPEHKIAWVIVIFLFPVAGGIFYLHYGSHRVGRKAKKMHLQVENKIKKASDSIAKIDNLQNHSDVTIRQIEYLKNKANAPAFENTSVTYFSLGEEMHEAMLAELKKAEKFIFIESFIIAEGKMWNEIEEILVERAQNGVDVRVLYDDLGCLMTLKSNFVKRLKANNIDARVFNKITHLINSNFNNRDHRKICVIDGNVGFNGGINIADQYINHVVKFGHWKDTAVMLKGEGVYGLTLMFLSLWDIVASKVDDFESYMPTIKETTDGIIQPFADNPLDGESVGETIYMSMLNTAKEYVYITSPYLVIAREMSISLINAAKLGVDVRLILPGIPDKKIVHFLSRSYYENLIKAGVRVFEYTPGFIHSKMFISDDRSAIVGTINLDYRSLNLHYECGTMLHNCSTIDTIKQDFLQTQDKSQEITLEMIKSKRRFSVVSFVALGVLRTFSPLF